ncbi:MAG: cell division/cell wall cluster transcriptional repressor MraZ [Oscillospiraceae bacterium]
MYFSGTFSHTLDTKKRLFIPAKFREGLGETFVLWSVKDEECIFAYSESDFENIASEIYANGTREMQRYFFQNAITVETDKQGRITIRSDFCEAAGLSKDITVAGVGKRIEIWDTKRREKAMSIADAASHTYPQFHF